jgi:cytochrome c oxidase subunit 3
MDTVDARPAAIPRGQTRPPLVSVGMVLFLGSELMFFAALFAMYFTLRAQSTAWPPRGVELDLPTAAVFTTFLVLSSGTMQLAIRSIREDSRPRMKRWIWVTSLLGAVFLAGQGYGYATLNFDVSSGAYGSAFYTMTGFHALHVLAGLVLMLVALGRAAAGAYSSQEHGGLEAIAYYWHFVDVVWIGLFSTIYLIR